MSSSACKARKAENSTRDVINVLKRFIIDPINDNVAVGRKSADYENIVRYFSGGCTCPKANILCFSSKVLFLISRAEAVHFLEKSATFSVSSGYY